MDWTTLRCVIPSESVAEEKLALDQGGPSSLGNMGGGAVDINSGGAVFFCVFDGGANEGETVAVVKFCANRLAAQSEYFAYEIANSLGVVAPTTRLFRKAAGRGVENTPPAAMGDVPGAPVPPADGREWSAALDAARRLSFPVLTSEPEQAVTAEAVTAEAVTAEAVREDADAAEALLDDEPRRLRYAAAGERHVRRFDWDRSAVELRDRLSRPSASG